MANKTASARVVRFVRELTITSKIRADSGRDHGLPTCGGLVALISVVTVRSWSGPSPVSGMSRANGPGRVVELSEMAGTVANMSDNAAAAAPVPAVATAPKRRGKSKHANWRRGGGDPVAVIKLELDLRGEMTRRRVENQWRAVFELRRALQRDAQARVDAYWAATGERAPGPETVRERLWLSRAGFEAAKRTKTRLPSPARTHDPLQVNS